MSRHATSGGNYSASLNRSRDAISGLLGVALRREKPISWNSAAFCSEYLSANKCIKQNSGQPRVSRTAPRPSADRSLPRQNELELSAADVVTQSRGFGFDFLQAVFHDVADGEDSDQPTILHDR